MKIRQIFAEALADPTILSWIETRRSGPKEFFGKKPDDELDPKYFIEPDGSPRIPPDIGDAFNYKLATPTMIAHFGRQYYNCSPLAAFHYLHFSFGQGKNQSNSLAGAKGFEFLSEAKLAFYSGRHGRPATDFSMECQGLGINRPGREMLEGDQFTERGNEVMADLLSQRTKLPEIRGLKEQDKKSLVFLLEGIEQTYKSGILEPRDWFYT